MGILDGIFGGENGIAKRLAETLGGTCVLSTVSGRSRDETTGRLVEERATTTVPFVPTANAQTSGESSAPVANGGNVAVPTTITGSIPAASVSEAPRAFVDSFYYRGGGYLITAVETRNVGNVAVAYVLTGTRKA